MSTWSLAVFLGQGRERKYMKRVAPGLAIWAEMQAAMVGVWKEGPVLGPENWIPASPDCNRIWSPELPGAAVQEWRPRAPMDRMYQTFWEW